MRGRHAGRRYAHPLHAPLAREVDRILSHLRSGTRAQECRRTLSTVPSSPFSRPRRSARGRASAFRRFTASRPRLADARKSDRSKVRERRSRLILPRTDKKPSEAAQATGHVRASARASGAAGRRQSSGARFCRRSPRRPRLRGRVSGNGGSRPWSCLNQAIDVVVSDVVMPGMSGVELARVIL